MHKQLCVYAAAFLMLAFATVACDLDSNTAGRSLTGPTASALASVTAEPAIIAAEFRPGNGCPDEAPFDARLTIAVRPTQDVFIRGFGFEFLDPFGRRVLPFVFPGTIELNNSVLLPVPVPTTHPIPFPGQVQMSSVLLQARGVLRIPFRVRFDCGVPAHGTLFVSVETADRQGTIDVSRISAQIR